MSPDGQITIAESEATDFLVQTTLRDPKTRNEVAVDCEVDTGNPTAIALPGSMNGQFNDPAGTEFYGGAGRGRSQCYHIDVVEIGGMPVDHSTICALALPNSGRKGLIGVDLLRYLRLEMYDEPDDKKMDLEMTYL